MAQTLGSVAVGTLVKLNENGSPVNYIVVHQGLPSAMYDASCDGTWVLRQNIWKDIVWNSNGKNTVAGSTMMNTVDGIVDLFDSPIQGIVKTVKIPYAQGGGTSTVYSGSNGLQCKGFLLAANEVGFQSGNDPFAQDGAKLAYFISGNNESAANNLRKSTDHWMTRTPDTSDDNSVVGVNSSGFKSGFAALSSALGARPAIILQSTAFVLDDGSVVATFPAPSALTVPIQSMQGNQITVSWSAVDGADGYILERKANTDADWTQVYSGANTSFEETVGTWTSVQYRVKAGVSGTYGDYTTSASVPVVSASAVVISGADGDLGTLVNDVSYTVSSDGSTELTVVETINGTETRMFTATNGGTNKIPVVDLPTGYGTISITASTNPGSGVVSVTREWTYTKAAITFPDAGSVADLIQNGQTIWAKTIAEAVRTPSIWGGNLGLALSKLAQAMLFDPDSGAFTDISGGAIPMVQIETGSYVGTGTSGSSNPNTLTFEFEPKALFIQEENDDYQALMLPGKTISYPFYSNGGDIMFPSRSYNRVVFSGSSVSWYCDGADSLATVQLNQPNVNYYYLVLG